MKRVGGTLAFLLMCAIPDSSKLPAAQDPPGLSLKETFQTYVDAVQKADLNRLFTTVTNNEKFIFLTSSGKLIATREGYYKFHEERFKEKDWEMPVELLELHEGKDYGYTVAAFHYRSKTPVGETSVLDSYFTLIFHREDGMWKVVADVCTPISRYLGEADTEIRYSAEQAYLLEMIRNRRTVRRFKSSPVPRKHLMKILEAAHFAASAGNQQPWRFLVIQDKAMLARLKEEALIWGLEAYKEQMNPTPEDLDKAREATKKYLEGVLSAPVYVAVLVDAKARYPDFIIYDGTLAAGNLMIAARALGYGTGFFTFLPEAKVKPFFTIPEQYKLICFTPIGVPEEWPPMPPKKSLEEVVVFGKF